MYILQHSIILSSDGKKFILSFDLSEEIIIYSNKIFLRFIIKINILNYTVLVKLNYKLIPSSINLTIKTS